MTVLPRLLAAPIAVLAAAGPAQAFDAADLLDAWHANAAAEGGSLAIGATRDTASGLILSDIGFTYADAAETITATLERIDMRSLDDGSVRVSVPGDQTLLLTAADPDAAPTRATLSLGGALDLLARGDLPHPDYDLSAESFNVELSGLDGADTPFETAFSIALSGLAGTLPGLDPGNDGPATANLDIAAMALTFALEDPAAGTGSRVVGTYADLSADIVPPPAGRAAITGPEALADLHGSAAMTLGPSRTVLTQSDPALGESETVIAQQSATLDLRIADGALSYDSTGTGIEMRLLSDTLPVSPLDLDIAAARMRLTAPLDGPEGATTVRLTGDIRDIALDPTMWDALDPTGALPRDPAQVTLDLEGTLAPVALPAGAGAESAFLPQRMTINALSIDALGATLDLTGRFDFPDDNPLTMPELTNPVGELEVVARGAMGLLQRLVAAGLLSGEQSMGAQMMLGMFATQAEDGSLRSHVVTDPDGGLTVNGTRLR